VNKDGLIAITTKVWTKIVCNNYKAVKKDNLLAIIRKLLRRIYKAEKKDGLAVIIRALKKDGLVAIIRRCERRSLRCNNYKAVQRMV
jgi:hypothetical protein